RMHGNLLQAALPPAVGVILFGGPERSRIDSADEEHEEEIASAFKGGLFANRLLLPNEDLVDDEKLKKLEVENKAGDQERPTFVVDLTDRNLAEARLEYADLRAIKLERANLQSATLAGAWLQSSSLHFARLQGANLREAQLQSANLDDARLQGVDL